MKLKLFGTAIAASAVGFVAFGGSHSAFASCVDDVTALKQVVEQEQDATKKQAAQEELKAAQAAAAAQDDAGCQAHLQRARDHVKK